GHEGGDADHRGRVSGMSRLLPGLAVAFHVFPENGVPSQVVRRAAGANGDAIASLTHRHEALLAVYRQQHGRMGLLVGLRDAHVRFVECRVVVVLPLDAREVLLGPELLQKLQVLKKDLPTFLGTPRACSGTVNEPAFADLVGYRYLLGDL